VAPLSASSVESVDNAPRAATCRALITRRAGLVLAGVITLTAAAAAGPIDPALRFQSVRTPHFVIHYHQQEEALASRLAAIAEATHVRLTTLAGSGHERRVTHVVLADQTDVPNGAATVVPWNAIYIYPVPPTGGDMIGNTDDWLEYVFTHEYVHIVHLDRSRGWARAARALFGRSPVAFPNQTLPLWHVEGRATFAESAGGHGRLRGGDFREVVDAAARQGRFEPLDRVNGGLVDWPAGHGWYAYGARFHEFLSARYGAERLRALADATAGRLPFFGSGAFTQVYGKPLGTLWTEFRNAVAEQAGPSKDIGGHGVQRLTSIGFDVGGARAAPDGTLYFTVTDPRRFPGIYRLPPGANRPERVTSRYGGTGLTRSGSSLVFDQLEFSRGVALFGDLYAYDLATGGTRRLTRDARLADPDLSRQGRLAAVQIETGARSIVLLDAERVLTGEAASGGELPVLARSQTAAAVYALPRWSPDGRTIAAERRTRDGRSEIVLLDGQTLEERAIAASSPDGRRITPEWSADGRTLYFASDHGEGPFQIYAVAVEPEREAGQARLVLEAAGGARSPTLLPDGSLVFVGYTAGGFDLFRGSPAEDRADAARLDAGDPREATGISAREAPETTMPALSSGPYEPWATLLPRTWLPVVERRDARWRAGAAVAGADVLGRHVVGASATWALTAGPFAGGIAPRGRPDWTASYTYQRWQPSLYASVQDRTTLFQSVDAAGALVPVAQREQQLDAGVWRPFRRVRRTHTALVAYHLERLTTTTPGAERSADRAGVRAAWTFSSARRYGYSISLEDGYALAATAEVLRPALGADGASEAFTADARVYLPLGFPHGVAAIRGAVAAASGDAGIRRAFRLGGVDDNAALGAFGSDAVSLLRGFQQHVFPGRRVALVNAEARVPIAWPQRGLGTWPIFLRALHATAFADVGHAWTTEPRWSDRKVGYGAELSADIVAGFGLPLTCSVGAAWGRDGASVVAPQREIYFRMGRSF
jgi:WD40-like Beta Propeller Repeat